jgi:hypothetical protein
MNNTAREINYSKQPGFPTPAQNRRKRHKLNKAARTGEWHQHEPGKRCPSCRTPRSHK